MNILKGPDLKKINSLDAIVLDAALKSTLKRQLYEQLRRLISGRILAPGSEMPSTRQLAKDLAIGRNTVVAAYEQLMTEGYLQNRHTACPVVVDLPSGPMSHEDERAYSFRPSISRRGEMMMGEPFYVGAAGQPSFHPGMPDAQEFPFTAWSRLLARRGASGRDTLFGTYDVLGFPPLREAIASYLNAARGMRCSTEQVVIISGAQGAFDLLARLLLDPGDTVWMEEPGYFGAQSAFEVAGARLAPLHVDGGGWSLDGWPSPAPRVICVTPSCHHPLGATMRMEQRLRLLEIAESCNAWIIEDDYDSEYRFQGQPIPAMQGSDASRRVIYVGTFSKLLFPALRIGFMVLPAGLVSGISQAINVSGHVPPLLLQAALFDFINEGHMAKHLRRTRRLYAMRREAFLTMGEAQLSQWLQLAPGQSGIQTTAFCRNGLDDHAIAAAAKKRGIHVSPLSMQYRHGKPRHGLVLGYAATSVSHMDSGMQKLREALLEVAG
ncbi:rhizopine catabolism transcriptional regulator MocR [Verminephrobacter eiseniae]|uniref:rhizopine catabolism transcriptional regulator MocR n=1 Tax=Verminephrobacter eiseniae TaxID=364317 RepID=UPI0022377B32|nr:PLP-dependent aminotransferase family protein [Verminephrobacter eiseniae]MCW5234842.1 PLP-dependent aminotransferase family protein [Verminephrobacter eiseniae]